MCLIREAFGCERRLSDVSSKIGESHSACSERRTCRQQCVDVSCHAVADSRRLTREATAEFDVTKASSGNVCNTAGRAEDLSRAYAVWAYTASLSANDRDARETCFSHAYASGRTCLSTAGLRRRLVPRHHCLLRLEQAASRWGCSA